MFQGLAEGRLNWLVERGIGFVPIVDPIEYGADYWNEYVRRADTDIGRALMRERVEFVARHFRDAGVVVDVGIGSGAFIDARERVRRGLTWGYDVNPIAVEWLRTRGILFDPYHPGDLGGPPTIAGCFFDVLEHIPDFRPILAPFSHIFVSIPIFVGPDHAIRSKHFKPREHCWYFTEAGFCSLLDDLGFELLEVNETEKLIGREDVMSFAFARR